jgi:two-component system sensor histidine kinase SaeS
MLNSRKLQFPLVKIGSLALAVVVVAALVAAGLAALWLQPSFKDLTELFIYLLASGGISAISVLVWLAYSQRQVGLRFQLTVAYLTGAVITFINILITANLMFLNPHDLNILLLLILFSGAIVIFFALFLSKQLGHPVAELTRGAAELANGNFTARVKPGGSAELARLATAFNQMAGQLENAFAVQQEMEQSRKELVAAISHDLRTPLASLRLMTEAVSDGVADERQSAIFLERMRGEVQYMTSLIEDLFEISSLDAGSLKPKLERGTLADLISDTLESLQSQAHQKGQTLQGEIQGELPEIAFDSHQIQRVLNNLVGNAIRYTPPGGSIRLLAQPEADRVVVRVEDNGEGISAADQAKIFEPFYRGERSRGREHGGTGLGLAIAQRLVEAHQGRIWVQSREGQGSTFIFELPVSNK